MQLEHIQLSLQMGFRSIYRSKRISYFFTTDFPVLNSCLLRDTVVPKGIRTPVAAVKGQCPRPLDDGDLTV